MSKVKEHPILFSSEMVRAILEGRKTQTRRVVKLPQWSTLDWNDFEVDDHGTPALICEDTGCMADVPCPYGQPGDRLWVRETFDLDWGYDDQGKKEWNVIYRADLKPEEEADDAKWKPSIFMPRWASRITLEIVNVRVERVQEINEADAQHEGWFFQNVGMNDTYDPVTMDCARRWYADLWDKINGKQYPWASNPWVWVVEFKRLP